jgi:hypothetical protein
MTCDEKKKIISSYQQICIDFLATVKPLSGKELNFRPESGFWTIREHVVHVMDCEVFGFTRYRKAIAQPGSMVECFDENKLQSDLDYGTINLSDSLLLIQSLVGITVCHLNSIRDTEWDTFRIRHPERGEVNLPRLIETRITHIQKHLDYIARNRNLFASNKTKPG